MKFSRTQNTIFAVLFLFSMLNGVLRVNLKQRNETQQQEIDEIKRQLEESNKKIELINDIHQKVMTLDPFNRGVETQSLSQF